MSYENDNLINLNLSAEELNKKIDNNTYQLRFVLEKFSQQLNEWLEKNKKNENKINIEDVKNITLTIQKLKQVLINHQNKINQHQDLMNKILGSLILIFNLFKNVKEQEKETSSFYDNIFIIKLLFKINHEGFFSLLHSNINLRNILFNDLYQVNQFRKEIDSILIKIMIEFKIPNDEKKAYREFVKNILTIYYGEFNKQKIEVSELIKKLIDYSRLFLSEDDTITFGDVFLNTVLQLFEKYDSKNKDLFNNFFYKLSDNASKGEVSKKKWQIDILLQIFVRIIYLNNTEINQLFFHNFFLNIKSAEKYDELLKHTKYKDYFLNVLPNLSDSNILMNYFSHLVTIYSNENNSNLIPEIDLRLIFDNLKIYLKNEDNNIFTLINCQLYSLIIKKENILQHILTTEFYSQKIEKIVEDTNFSEEFRFNILTFFKKLYAYNEGNIKMIIFFKVRDGEGRINKLINWMSLEYETDSNKLNDKIKKVIEISDNHFLKKEMKKMITFLRLILKSLYKKRFIEINKLEETTIAKLNSFLLKVGKNFGDNDIDDLNIKKYLKLIFKFTFELNRRKLEETLLKINHIPTLFHSIHIIKKECFELIIENFLISNLEVMNIVYDYLLNIAILDDKIIVSPYILILIIKLLMKNSNFTQIKKIFSLLNNLFDYCDVNIKVMLFHKNFILILMKIYTNITDDEIKEMLLLTLFKFTKYISRYYLEKYFFKIYKYIIEYKENYINFTYDNSILKKLLDHLNHSLEESKNKVTNCIYFSKRTYFNPLIYNMIYMNDLICTNNSSLTILMYLKITSYDNIDGFHLCNLNSRNKNSLFISSITFQIGKNKELIIQEKDQISKIINTHTINSFNEILKCDGQYHQILIIFNFEKKTINLSIDDSFINEIEFKLFTLEVLEVNIGFSGNGLSNNQDIFMLNQHKNPVSIISLPYLLICNETLESKEIKIIKKYNIDKGKTLTLCNLIDKEINSLFKEKILNEISFDFQNCELLNFKTLNHNLKDAFQKYSFYKHYYIPCIEIMNTSSAKNRFSKTYMLSVNDNLLNYICLNKRLKLENIYIEKMYYKYYQNFGIDQAINNSFFTELIIGFLYEFDKFEDIKNTEKIILQLLRILLHSELINNLFKEDNKLSLQFRIYFEKNYEVFNYIIFDFLTLLFELKNDIDGNICALYFYSNILTNPFIFNLLKRKKEILNYLTDYLVKYKNHNTQNVKLLFSILKNLCIFLFLYEIKENEEETLEEIFESIIKNVTVILELIKKYGFTSIKKTTQELFLFIVSNFNSFKTKFLNHKGEEFCKKYSNLIPENNFLNSQTIKTQLIKCYNEISIKFANNENSIAYNEECQFCLLIIKYMEINWNHLFDLMNYEKNKKQYFLYAFQNHKKYKMNEKNPSINSWYLSSKEGMSRIINQFVLKENDIKIYNIYNERKKIYIKRYQYLFYDRYRKYFKELNKILIYSNLCEKESGHLIENIRNKEFTNSFRLNCLYYKRIQKINSLFVLTDKNFYIIGNILQDSNGIIHVCNGELQLDFWAKSVEKAEKELNEYILKSENYYSNLDIENDSEGKTPVTLSSIKFNYEYNQKPIFKKISLKNISEIYQRDFLHIENALEILLKNGSSYFIIFNKGKREEVFRKILLNINNIYKEDPVKMINNLTSETKLTKQYFYMRYYPSKLLQLKTKKEKLYVKNLSNSQELLSYCSKNWKSNKISNFDYLMLLNTLANRGYNVLSQYFIFPWIISNFPKEGNLNIFQNNFYRDLSYPIFAQNPIIREDLLNKYELRDIDDKYHSGTIFSTHAFVNYFNVRQRPYSECALEIQGGEFDASDRLFIGKEQLNCNEDKYLELIPSLYTIPEMFINFNDFEFGIRQNSEIVDDFVLPNFFKSDSRFFTLVKKKLLESKKVSENLNNWIDLIFGCKQNGEEAIKVLNTYRGACNKFSEGEIEKMEDNDLNMILIEKCEFGCFPDQLFTKRHIKKDKCYWINKSKIFFDSDNKINKIQIVKLDKINFLKNCNIEINDFEILDQNTFISNNQYFKGGISSLFSLMNSLSKKESPDNIEEIFNPNKNYFVIGKNCVFFNKNKNKFLTFHHNYISLVKPKKKMTIEYSTGEPSNISSLISSFNGKKIFVGFTNGNIKEYSCSKAPENDNSDSVLEMNLSESIKKYQNKFYLKNEEKKVNNDNLIPSFKTIFISKTNKAFNYSKHPITKLKLNEAFNILIASDFSNTIYILSLGYNNLKLIHKVQFLTNTKYPIKDILPIYSNGDFVVYTKFTVYLFSINGVPLCDLDILENKSYEFYPIIYATASFVGDCILFLSHMDGTISIWIVMDKNIKSEKHERFIIDIYSKKKEKALNDIRYTYCENNKIKNKEDRNLMRRFNLESFICHPNKLPFIFMKINDEKNYMLLIDSNYNVFYMNSNIQKKFSMLKIFKSNVCSVCEDDINENIKNNLPNDNSNQSNKKDNNILVCGKCKDSLTKSENILYN